MPLFTVVKKPKDNSPFIKPNQFSEGDLPIAQLIQRRRLQMLVHSYIYYVLDNNIVSDITFSKWAKELATLQEQYPEIAKRVCYAEAFIGWDGSTGAFLPLNDEWVVKRAHRLLNRRKL